MPEPLPTYSATYSDEVVYLEEGGPLPEWYRAELNHRRRQLIEDLRHTERQLGIPQTIPERKR
jgi:hypothetical protein